MESFLRTGKLGADSATPSVSKKSETSTKKRGPIPWVEKYRPKTVDDVAYQDEVVAVLKKSLEGADLPNLLFYGPPGTGKTSTILAAARDLFGPELYRSRILELNASDERGISVVRDKVKTFAQLTASGRRTDGKPCPPFKIIILDEADSITKDAQSALRRTMEKEGKSTKFCLICNYVSRIIEPLTSRCAKFRFKPLSKDVLMERLRFIASEEKISVSPEAMDALLETSEGDLRKAITSLQSCARLKGTSEEITKADVYELSGVVPEEWINQFITACESNSMDQVQKCVDDISYEGFSVIQIISQLNDLVVAADLDRFSDKQKSTLCECMAINEARLLQGSNEYLAMMNVAKTMMKAIAIGA